MWVLCTLGWAGVYLSAKRFVPTRCFRIQLPVLQTVLPRCSQGFVVDGNRGWVSDRHIAEVSTRSKNEMLGNDALSVQPHPWPCVS